MNILIAAKDAVFARMLALEFEDKHMRALCTSDLSEIKEMIPNTRMAIVDARFLSQGPLPNFPYDTILFGYPDEFAAISTQELTKYYTIERPFLIEELFQALFVSNEDQTETIRAPKRKSPAESLALDTENHVAYYKGEKIALTQKEFALLALLYENRGTPVSREHALAEVFSDAETKTNVVDVYVNYLRTKIDSRFDIRMISTVRGLGYVIAK